MQLIREKIEVMKQTLDDIEDRLLQKPLAQSMKGKRFLYRLKEIQRDIASTEKLLEKLDEIDRKYGQQK